MIKRARVNDDEEVAVKDFFQKMFIEKNRRTALLCRWLCIVPDGDQNRNTLDAFKNIFRALVVEKTNFYIESYGIRINSLITFPNEILLRHELTQIQGMRDRRRAFFHGNTFKYNHLVFTDEQRQLLCRDFVNICFLQHTRLERFRWPLFALMAVQHLLFIEECKDPALFDAEQVLQGLGKSHELPIYNNRGRK
jgi:hypothetical protein